MSAGLKHAAASDLQLPKRQLPRLRSNAWFRHFSVLVLSIAVLVLVIAPPIDREHGDEALTTNERYQTHSRRIQSKGDKHQVDHGQTGSLSLLPLFDYEHKHRDAEHEHDNETDAV